MNGFFHTLSDQKPSQRYLIFGDEEKIGKNCVSRKDAKNRKFEARNPKFETNSKQEIQNKYNVPNRRDRIRRFGFSEFEISLTAFVSDFDIRISDLFSWLLGAITFFVTSIWSIKCWRRMLRLRSVSA
jgi:hypothetical protein